MVATKPYVEACFERFNREIFRGELPPIDIRMSNAKGFLGKLCFRRTRSFFGQEKYSDFCLRINTRIDLPEAELEDTVIHEMIHYYIALRGIRDTSAHGMEFRRLMTHINRTYGRHVSISHRTTAVEREQLAGTAATPRVIGLIALSDGKTCIKRIPVQGRMGYGAMDRKLRQCFQVVSTAWYFTTDPYFGQFPSSLALRMTIVSREEVLPHLQGAHPLPLREN